MAFILHVEFDASSETAAAKMLELLASMANIVHRDHPEVYTYLFRHSTETKTKLFFTEIYGNEQVFLDHARDPKFTSLYQQAFDSATGKSRKELCIRNDTNSPLLPITAHILDNYLHVTYLSLQQGFFQQDLPDTKDESFLIVCTGCDKNVYEQLNELVNCVTCVVFEESNKNRQLIAIITQISTKNRPIKNNIPSIDAVELVCSQEETIQKFKNLLTEYFQVQSLQIQTNFSGYIHHKSS